MLINLDFDTVFDFIIFTFIFLDITLNNLIMTFFLISQSNMFLFPLYSDNLAHFPDSIFCREIKLSPYKVNKEDASFVNCIFQYFLLINPIRVCGLDGPITLFANSHADDQVARILYNHGNFYLIIIGL
jgi:hypothetical protein